MSALRRTTVLLACLGTVASLISAPAQAAANPATICNTQHGGGFYELDHANLAAQGAGGTVYLMFNGRYKCVVTIKTVAVGTPTPTNARLHDYYGSLGQDGGSFGSYAGPVYRYAPTTCVEWGGSVSDNSGLGNHQDSYLSPFEHGSCTFGARIADRAYTELDDDARNREISGANCNYYSGYWDKGGTCSHSGFRTQEWCADFAKFIWSRLSVKDWNDLTSWSLQFRKYGTDHNTWYNDFDAGLRLGDAVVYDDRDGTGHVGIVVDVNSPAGDSWVISGNYSNAIKKHRLSARPNYDGHTRPVQ